MGVGTAAVAAGASAYSASKQSEATGKAQAASQDAWLAGQKRNDLASTQAISNLDPYAQTGLAANDTLSRMLVPGGELLRPYDMAQYQEDPGYTPMVHDLASLQATPGYQFQLEQGLQSLGNSGSSKGSYLSGSQIKDVNNYAQGVASTGYQAAWDRAQQAYQNAFGRNSTNKQNTYNFLNGQATRGQAAASDQANTLMQSANMTYGNSMQNGSNQASLALRQGDNSQNLATGLSNTVNSLAGYYAANGKNTGTGGTYNGTYAADPLAQNSLLSQGSMGFQNTATNF